MCVPEFLLPHKKIRMFGPKTAIFAQKYAFIVKYRPCRIIWCTVGRLVGGCGAPAVFSQDTYFLYVDSHSFCWKSTKKRDPPPLGNAQEKKKMSHEDVHKKHQILSFMFLGHHFAMYFDVLY